MRRRADALVLASQPLTHSHIAYIQQTRKEFILGRSTGKKVKETGVSLPQDPEVSTIHGKVSAVLIWHALDGLIGPLWPVCVRWLACWLWTWSVGPSMHT